MRASHSGHSGIVVSIVVPNFDGVRETVNYVHPMYLESCGQPSCVTAASGPTRLSGGLTRLSGGLTRLSGGLMRLSGGLTQPPIRRLLAQLSDGLAADAPRQTIDSAATARSLSSMEL